MSKSVANVLREAMFLTFRELYVIGMTIINWKIGRKCEMNLLYYPRILVPISDLKKYILYSDSISTIIPDEFQFNVTDIDDIAWNESLAAIRQLEELGIYKRTYASTILSTHKERIFDEFKKRICSLDAVSKLKRGIRPSSWWQLYLSKIDHDLRSLLIDEGLAKVENHNILNVEADTASVYMGLLAEYSCLYGNEFYSTVTDKEYFRSLVFNPVGDRVTKTKFTLTEVLPTPCENISIDDILKFKESRKFELLRFQALLSSFESELMDIDDLREYQTKLNSIGRHLKIQSEELKTLLKEHRIICFANSIDKVINAAPKFVQHLLTGEDIIKVTSVAEKYVENKQIHRGNDTSYLFRAEQLGII